MCLPQQQVASYIVGAKAPLALACSGGSSDAGSSGPMPSAQTAGASRVLGAVAYAPSPSFEPNADVEAALQRSRELQRLLQQSAASAERFLGMGRGPPAVNVVSTEAGTTAGDGGSVAGVDGEKLSPPGGMAGRDGLAHATVSCSGGMQRLSHGQGAGAGAHGHGHPCMASTGGVGAAGTGGSGDGFSSANNLAIGGDSIGGSGGCSGGNSLASTATELANGQPASPPLPAWSHKVQSPAASSQLATSATATGSLTRGSSESSLVAPAVSQVLAAPAEQPPAPQLRTRPSRRLGTDVPPAPPQPPIPTLAGNRGGAPLGYPSERAEPTPFQRARGTSSAAGSDMAFGSAASGEAWSEPSSSQGASSEGESSAEPEEDNSWESQVREGFAQPMREAEKARRLAETNVSRLRRQLQLLRTERGKCEQRLRGELTEAQKELQTAEQRSAARLRSLRDGEERVEMMVRAARNELVSTEQEMVTRRVHHEEALEPLAVRLQLEHDDAVHAAARESDLETEQAASEEAHRRCTKRMADAREESRRLRRSVNLMEQLMEAERKAEEECSQQKEDEEHCRRLAAQLREVQDAILFSAAAVPRAATELEQARSELAGFREAMDWSMRAANSRLLQEVELLRAEAVRARRRLDSIALAGCASTGCSVSSTAPPALPAPLIFRRPSSPHSIRHSVASSGAGHAHERDGSRSPDLPSSPGSSCRWSRAGDMLMNALHSLRDDASRHHELVAGLCRSIGSSCELPVATARSLSPVSAPRSSPGSSCRRVLEKSPLSRSRGRLTSDARSRKSSDWTRSQRHYFAEVASMEAALSRAAEARDKVAEAAEQATCRREAVEAELHDLRAQRLIAPRRQHRLHEPVLRPPSYFDAVQGSPGSSASTAIADSRVRRVHNEELVAQVASMQQCESSAAKFGSEAAERLAALRTERMCLGRLENSVGQMADRVGQARAELRREAGLASKLQEMRAFSEIGAHSRAELMSQRAEHATMLEARHRGEEQLAQLYAVIGDLRGSVSSLIRHLSDSTSKVFALREPQVEAYEVALHHLRTANASSADKGGGCGGGADGPHSQRSGVSGLGHPAAEDRTDISPAPSARGGSSAAAEAAAAAVASSMDGGLLRPEDIVSLQQMAVALQSLREEQLLQSSRVASMELAEMLAQESDKKAVEALAQEANQQLRQYEKHVGHERQALVTLLEDGYQKRRELEQHLRREIQRLRRGAESPAVSGGSCGGCSAGSSGAAAGAGEPMDHTVLVHMNTVVSETRHFLRDQQERLEGILAEHVELRRRLTEALHHLEGPESAQQVLQQALFSEEDLRSQRELVLAREGQCQVHAEILAEMMRAQRLPQGPPTCDEPVVHLSDSWVPPPSIAEESPRELPDSPYR